MKFKAVLIGALVNPFGDRKSVKIPWQKYCSTQEQAERYGKDILYSLSEEEQIVAYIKIVELKEVLLAEIHTAKEKGPDKELIFAIARP